MNLGSTIFSVETLLIQYHVNLSVYVDSPTPTCVRVFSVQSHMDFAKFMPGYSGVWECYYKWFLLFPNYLLVYRNIFDCYTLILYHVTFLNSLLYFTHFLNSFFGVFYTSCHLLLQGHFPVSMQFLSSALGHGKGSLRNVRYRRWE